MEEMFQVGVISSTHGIAGEVKVYPTTDDIRRFKERPIFLRGAQRAKLRFCRFCFFPDLLQPLWHTYTSFSVISICGRRSCALNGTRSII